MSVFGEFFCAFSDGVFFAFFSFYHPCAREVARPPTFGLEVAAATLAHAPRPSAARRRASQAIHRASALFFFLRIFLQTLANVFVVFQVSHIFFPNLHIYTIFHRAAIFFAFCAAFSAIFSALYYIDIFFF